MLNPNTTAQSLILESNMDFMIAMGLLGKKQEVLLYQVGTKDGAVDRVCRASNRC